MVERICTPLQSREESVGGALHDSIWKIVLQAAHKEPGIRHLVLAIGHLKQPRKSTSFPFIQKLHSPLVFQNQLLAKHQLNILFKSQSPNAQIYETAFMALYLLTYIHLLLNRPKTGRSYHQIAFRVLRRALMVFGSGDEGKGEKLPGCMREVVGAFGRLKV